MEEDDFPICITSGWKRQVKALMGKGRPEVLFSISYLTLGWEILMESLLIWEGGLSKRKKKERMKERKKEKLCMVYFLLLLKFLYKIKC